jgi:hypothetical protein
MERSGRERAINRERETERGEKGRERKEEKTREKIKRDISRRSKKDIRSQPYLSDCLLKNNLVFTSMMLDIE